MSKNKVTKRQVNIKKGQRYIPKGFPQTDAGWEDYLELCGNLQNFAYNKDTSADPDFDTKGYQQLKEYSNIRYRVFVNPKTKHGIVVYRGTDFSSKEDVKADTYIARGTQDNSTAFQEAEALFKRVTQANKGIKFDTTGHSLGGGKAIYITTKFQDVHAMAFNPGLTPPSIAKYRKKGGDFDPSKCLVIRNTSDPVSHAFIRYNMSATTWDTHNINRVSYANPSQASNIPGQLLDDHGSAQFTKGQTREQSLKDGEEYYSYDEYDGKSHYDNLHKVTGKGFAGGGGTVKGIKKLMEFRKKYFEENYPSLFGEKSKQAQPLRGEGPPGDVGEGPPEDIDSFEEMYLKYKDISSFDEDIDVLDEKYPDSGFDEAPERPSILDDPALNPPEEPVAEGRPGSYGTFPEETLEEGLVDIELGEAETGLSMVMNTLEILEEMSFPALGAMQMLGPIGQGGRMSFNEGFDLPNPSENPYNWMGNRKEGISYSFNSPQYYFNYIHYNYEHADKYIKDKYTFKEFVREYGGKTSTSKDFNNVYMKGLDKKIYGQSQMTMGQYIWSSAPSRAYFEALREYKAHKGEHFLKDLYYKEKVDRLLKEYQLQNAIRYSVRVPDIVEAKGPNGKMVQYNLKNLSAPGAMVPYLPPEIERLLDRYRRADFNEYEKRDFEKYKFFLEQKHQPIIDRTTGRPVPMPHMTREKQKEWDESQWSFAEQALLDNYAPYRAYRQETHMQTAMEKVGTNSIEETPTTSEEENPSKRQKTQPSMSNNDGFEHWAGERSGGGIMINKNTGKAITPVNVPQPFDGRGDYRPPHDFTPHPGATPGMGEHIDKDENKFLQIMRNMIHDEIIQKGGAGRYNDGRNPHQGSFGFNGDHIEEMGTDMNYHNYDATNPHQHFGEAVPSGNLKASSYQQYFKRPAKGSTLHNNVGLAIAADFAASVAQQRADAIGY